MGRGFLVGVGLGFVSVAQAGNIVLVSDMTTAHSAAPGSVVRGVLEVRNTGEVSETLSVTLKDFATRAPDTRDILQSDTTDRSLGSWLTLEQDALTVPPGQLRSIPYQIQVPDQPDLAGSYWTILMLEEGSTPTIATAGSMSLLQRSRIASRVLVNVSGGSRVVTFTASGIEQQGAGTVFYTDIENTGTTALPLAPKLELYDQRGRKQATYQGQQATLYPGSSWRYSIDLTAAPPGDYTAILIADGGEGALFGARHPVHLD